MALPNMLFFNKKTRPGRSQNHPKPSVASAWLVATRLALGVTLLTVFTAAIYVLVPAYILYEEVTANYGSLTLRRAMVEAGIPAERQAPSFVSALKVQSQITFMALSAGTSRSEIVGGDWYFPPKIFSRVDTPEADVYLRMRRNCEGNDARGTIRYTHVKPGYSWTEVVADPEVAAAENYDTLFTGNWARTRSFRSQPLWHYPSIHFFTTPPRDLRLESTWPGFVFDCKATAPKDAIALSFQAAGISPSLTDLLNDKKLEGKNLLGPSKMGTTSIALDQSLRLTRAAVRSSFQRRVHPDGSVALIMTLQTPKESFAMRRAFDEINASLEKAGVPKRGYDLERFGTESQRTMTYFKADNVSITVSLRQGRGNGGPKMQVTWTAFSNPARILAPRTGNSPRWTISPIP